MQNLEDLPRPGRWIVTFPPVPDARSGGGPVAALGAWRRAGGAAGSGTARGLSRRSQLTDALAPGAARLGAHRGDAVHGTRRHGAGAPAPFDPDRPAVGVRCGRGLGIAEDVVDQRHQGAESLGGSLEHMFVKVRRGADGTGGLQGILQSGLEAPRGRGAERVRRPGEAGHGGVRPSREDQGTAGSGRPGRTRARRLRRRGRTRRPAWCGCARRLPW